MLAKKVLSNSPKRCRLGFVSETHLVAPFSSKGVPSGAPAEPAKPLHCQRRNFSSGAASPPRQPPPSALAAPGTDYISLFQPTYRNALTGIGTFTPGSVLKGYPLPQYVLKEDIIRHLEMSNRQSENVKIVYDSVFRPKYVQFEVDSAAAQRQITKCLQERGRLGCRIMKAEVSPAMHWTVVDAALKDSPRGRTWHKLSSNGVGISSRHPKHEVFRTQALKFSSVASPVSEKDGNSDSSVEDTCVSGDEKVEHVSETNDEPALEVDKEQAAKAEQEDKEALLNSIAQLEALLSEKNSQLVELKERAVTTKAELENVRTRAQREADNTRKYAVQEFAKSLLDVADNLGRALMTIPANVRKELLTDQSETGKLLKCLVEGLIMTERELMKVLKKFGVEKFEPVGQQFDPNSHLALFEVADPSKEPGTVALVAKVGYMLHDRVLRPAEVGVIKSLE